MANYYHEARAQSKKIKEIQEDNKRRAERRAEQSGNQPEYPVNILAIEGRACKLYKNAEQHQSLERMDGMLPWNGHQDNMIDRFDGRALLDFYRESDVSRDRPKTADDRRLERLLAFESFRDLVRLDAKGFTEEHGIAAVQKESIEARAALRAAAAAAAAAQQQGQRGAQPTSGPAGQGLYGAVGFAYNGEEDLLAAISSGEDSSSDEEEEAPPVTNEDLAEDAEDDRMDELAEKYGVQDYAYLLHKISKQEGEEDELRRKRPRRKFSRKKAAARARRMAGQGKGPLMLPKEKLRDVKPAAVQDDRYQPRRPDHRTDSWHPYRRRSRSRSPPRRREERPRTEYITEFAISAPSTSSHSRSHDPSSSYAPEPAARTDGILEALPDRPDPAICGGAVALPAQGAALQGHKATDAWARRDRDYDRDRDRDRDRGARDRDRDRLTGRAKAKPSPAANAPAAKETPQERLKRIMQAQLNKQLKKDTVTQTQKKVQAEKDRQARLQIERAALPRRSPSPRRRSRSRSQTPPWRRRRSRSPRY